MIKIEEEDEHSDNEFYCRVDKKDSHHSKRLIGSEVQNQTNTFDVLD